MHLVCIRFVIGIQRRRSKVRVVEGRILKDVTGVPEINQRKERTQENEQTVAVPPVCVLCSSFSCS